MKKEKRFHLSVTLSPSAISFVESIGARLGERNFSAALELVIQAHKDIQPDRLKQETIKQLTMAARILTEDCGFEKEAILSWAKEAIRGKK